MIPSVIGKSVTGGDIDDLLLVVDTPGYIHCHFIQETFDTSLLEVTAHSVLSSEAAINFLERRVEYAEIDE